MRAGGLGIVLLVGIIGGGGVGVIRWQAAIPSADAERSGIPAMLARGRTDSARVDSALDMLVDNDPFRFSNTPPTIRFDPTQPRAASAVAVPQARPRLVLRAVVGGPPWSAVIDGLPGQPPGAVVRPGSKFDALTVASVARDSVIVRASDTTWVLRFGGHP